MAKLQELSMQVLMGKYIVLCFHHGWNILRSRQLSASRDLPATTSRPEGRTKILLMESLVKMAVTSLTIMIAMIMLSPVQSSMIGSGNLQRSLTTYNNKLMPESRQFGNSQAEEANVSKTVKIQRYLIASFILQVSF